MRERGDGKGWQAGALVPLLMLLALFLGVAPAGAQGRIELVMFEEVGCPWCRRFDQEIAPAYPKTEEGRLAPLRRLDIGAARTSSIRLARPVTATPTFVLVIDNAEVGRLTGYPGADFFWGLLGEQLAKLPPRTERRASDVRQRIGDVTARRLAESRPSALSWPTC